MTSDSRQIRCPNCSRLTPLAPFCTHCGAVIPEGAGAARPRAMDRGELEARIRQRRTPDSPYLRGEPAAGPAPPSQAWHAPQEPASFVREPSDELARHEVEHAPDGQRVDYLDERAASQAADADPISGVAGIPGAAYSAAAAEWPSIERGEASSGSRDVADEAEAAEPSDAAVGPPAHQPTDFGGGSAYRRGESLHDEDGEPWSGDGHRFASDSRAADYVAAASAAGYGAAAGGGYATGTGVGEGRFAADAYGEGGAGNDGGDGSDWDGREWTPHDDEPPRRGSAALTIIGFVVLGIAALVGGALLFSVLNVPAGVASQSSSPTPTQQASGSSSEPAQESASPSESQSQSASPSAQAGNFSATTQPCATSDMGFKGCEVDGSTLDRGHVWVWVGFKNGTSDNVIGVTVLSKATNSAVGDGSLTLDQLSGCNPGKTCSGYIRMEFDNLAPGDYTIQITRDESQVASADFSVKKA